MASITLPDEVIARIREEADLLDMTYDERLAQIIQGMVAPAENLKPGFVDAGLKRLVATLSSIPGVSVLSDSGREPQWWIKLSINLSHTLAWHVVQELGFVLNYLSVSERLPTVFMPVSPPPYLNGGPSDFLSWAIEAKIPFLDAGYIAEVIEDRLPKPINDQSQWHRHSDGDDDTQDSD